MKMRHSYKYRAFFVKQCGGHIASVQLRTKPVQEPDRWSTQPKSKQSWGYTIPSRVSYIKSSNQQGNQEISKNHDKNWKKKKITVIYRDCNTGNGSHWTPVDRALLLQFIWTSHPKKILCTDLMPEGKLTMGRLQRRQYCSWKAAVILPAQDVCLRYFGLSSNITYNLWDILVWSIAAYFYELSRVKIYSDTTNQNI